MPPLVTFEEALALGALTDHDEIGDLVERAWEVRTQRFGDSTDLCSLVNAKSGGCAEDCGFCAQSRYAEADTPMHAMMEPEQMLEHAKAAEAAGAHRFCMVTQGQGLSKRDFEKILAGARLVADSGWCISRRTRMRSGESAAASWLVSLRTCTEGIIYWTKLFVKYRYLHSCIRVVCVVCGRIWLRSSATMVHTDTRCARAF